MGSRQRDDGHQSLRRLMRRSLGLLASRDRLTYTVMVGVQMTTGL